MHQAPKRIAIIGSTGSIGTQALEVISDYPDLFQAEVLTAHCNADLLIEQSIRYQPNAVVISNEDLYPKVVDALAPYPIKVYAGSESLEQIVSSDTIDIVLMALVGYAGMLPTIRAIEAKKTIALANKECLVVAGNLIMSLAQQHQCAIIPVDSEHSAIFQCLVGEHAAIDQIYLTASGGPFLHTPLEQLAKVKKADALKHPCWDMGAKITIDSASMMNKGFEVIEAHWLFDVPADKINVLVHPQSLIHSMVQFEDGSVKAQLGEPSMKIPIQYAFTFPERRPSNVPKINFSKYASLNFLQPDFQKFPCLSLAYEALNQGGNLACSMNAANEIAVDAFLNNRIAFTDISRLIEETMRQTIFLKDPNLDDYCATNTEARRIATLLAQKL